MYIYIYIYIYIFKLFILMKIIICTRTRIIKMCALTPKRTPESMMRCVWQFLLHQVLRSVAVCVVVQMCALPPCAYAGKYVPVCVMCAAVCVAVCVAVCCSVCCT